ncbi:MAG TPA: zinc-binding dehydrogenase [Planctomycetaceae bacterium]|jgi:threonine dehydrogenase-like Zn-dependent dehydrogenase|nr:zinc-binding dehydrogenase [Planctomycetaceae bacterium]
MSDTGIVAVFTGIRKPFQLREFPVPRPEPGAILVEVRMANVCGSDLHIWRGDYDVYRGQSEPFCLSIGHEMVGRIAALGEGVTHDWAGSSLAVGDRVAYQYFCPCGECRSCRTGRTPRCSQGHRYRSPPTDYPHFNAAYGQYYYLRRPQAVFKVPDNVPDILAGPANCALSQVIDGWERAAAGPGDSVVIQGAGGLGINAIAVAKERQVSQVIVIDGIDSRLELAHDFGADVTIDVKEFNSPQARVRRVRELTQGEGADVVMELVGAPAVVAEGIEMLCNGGTYVEIGNINQRLTCEFNPASIVHGGKTILGLMWYRPESLHQALQLLSTRADRYPFGKLLSQQFPLSAIDEAFREQDAGAVHRAALLPWG